MSPQRSGQHVALRSSNWDLMLYAAVVPLFAILLAYQVYVSPNKSFLDNLHDHSILSVISPVKLKPIIGHLEDSDSFLSALAAGIKLSSRCEFLGSCHPILTWQGFDTLASVAQWATDKLFTCEISYMVTIGISSFFTKFFRLTYLRIFISTASLLVTYASYFRVPKKPKSLRAARQQFKSRICAFCCVVFTATDYTTLVSATICILRCVVCESWGTKVKTWLTVKCVAVVVAMAVIWFHTVASFVWTGAKNVLESWQFVEVAREKEAARFGFEADATERMVNVIMHSRSFMENETEEREKEELLREILRLYE
ncbi:hypothetical protein V494_03817 [Pseudogymnoascus sp. VKM F-4513 (FW-928)]|nr:hypothetical protein V494_03817 [Pseudogymnoascus sp. VKM F-4513 (FW-928)]